MKELTPKNSWHIEEYERFALCWTLLNNEEIRWEAHLVIGWESDGTPTYFNSRTGSMDFFNPAVRPIQGGYVLSGKLMSNGDHTIACNDELEEAYIEGPNDDEEPILVQIIKAVYRLGIHIPTWSPKMLSEIKKG